MRFRPDLTPRRPRGATITAAAAALACAAAAGVGASPAQAAFANCGPGQAPPVYLGNVNVPVEGAVVDNQGRLWLTDLFGGRILRMDYPGAKATVVGTLPAKNGGGALGLLNDGTVIVGGGADPRVFLGDLLKPGFINTISDTGVQKRLATGFSAANGLAVAHDGTIYATNDFGSLIGRVAPDGKVSSAWGNYPSANGAYLNHDDSYLYFSRTFVNPGVSRINTTTKRVQSLLTFKGADALAAPDGLVLDSLDRPIVPTDVSGDMLRIDAPGTACRIANNLGNSSVIAYGKGKVGFAAGHLYRAGFDGKVYEIPAGFDPGAAGV